MFKLNPARVRAGVQACGRVEGRVTNVKNKIMPTFKNNNQLIKKYITTKDNKTCQNGKIILSNHVELETIELNRYAISDLVFLSKLSQNALIIFFYLIEHSEAGTNTMRISQKQIMQGLDLGRPTVVKNMQLLKEYEVIDYDEYAKFPTIKLNSKYYKKGDIIGNKVLENNKCNFPKFAQYFYSSKFDILECLNMDEERKQIHEQTQKDKLEEAIRIKKHYKKFDDFDDDDYIPNEQDLELLKEIMG